MTSIDLERPLRHPDAASAPLMNKRARWLVLLGCVLPGSAQVLAGSRKLGRFGLGATFTMLGVTVLALIGLMLFRATTLTILTNSLVLLALQVLIAGYAVLWLWLGFDTLRLTRLVRLSGGWRVPIALLSIVLTLVPVAGAAWVATTVGSARGAIGSIFGGGAPAVEPVDGRYNILLLGGDAGDGRDGLRPDSISLISVDAETGQSIVVGLPRELLNVPFTETSPMHALHPYGFGVGPNVFGDGFGYLCLSTTDNGDCFLNGVYSELEAHPDDTTYDGLYPDAVSRGSSPGIEATKDAVEGATGLDVQFYVLIDMQGFEQIIDALGGVTIDVQEALPIGGQIDDFGELVDVDGWIEPGVQKMDGFTAQWYARSRYGSERGDWDRMDRQRELQSAILAQMSPANVLLRFQELAAAGNALVQTDIPESMLGRFVDLATQAKDHSPVSVQLTPPAIDHESPNYDDARRLVAEGVAATTPVEETE